jgi:tripartite-type tricarboxylate transporter receptor subunit TctC
MNTLVTWMNSFFRFACFGLVWYAATSPSVADVADFYRGKQIRIVVGSDAGGGYDAYARTIAAHMGRFIPGNPSFIVQNMLGVGSLIAVNHVGNVAPKDGTVVGAINPSAVTAPLFHPEQAKFDARRLNWLGTPVTIAYTIVAWHTAPVQTFEDLFTTELLVGSAGGASRTLPMLANGVLGTKFKVVMGYKSAGASMLAIERGEVQGNGGEALSNLKAVHAGYLRDKRLRIIGTYALKPNPELVGVPMVIDFAKTDEQRAALKLVLSSQDIGWPYIMAPDVPADRVEAMRRAFDAMMKDSEFLADAAKRKLDIRPIRGEEQATLVDQTLATQRPVVELVKRIVGDQ